MPPGRTTPSRPIAPVDVAIAAAMLALGQVEVAVRGIDGGDPLAAHALWAAIAVCALFRRARPLLFALAAIAVEGLRYRYGLTPSGGAIFAIVMPLALYGVGAYGRDPLRSALLAAGTLLLDLGIAAGIALSDHGPLAHVSGAEWVGQFGIYLAAVAGGIALRDRAEVLRAARSRVASTPTAEEAADEALLEERTRIARELHAVVSASVRELLEEVERARGLSRSSPGRAREAIASARRSSQRGLDEMRRMLSLLRSPGPRPPALPESSPDRAPAVHAGPLARIPAPLQAQGLPLLVLIVGCAEALFSHVHPEIYGAAPLAVRLLGAAALAAAFLPRRRLPLLTAVAVGAVILVRGVVLDDQFALNLPLYLAAFAAGAYGRPFVLAVAGGVIVTAAVVATPTLVGVVMPFGAYLFVAITTGAAWATGVGGRRRLAEAAELRELAEQERRRNARVAERTVVEERLRVARELHDLVGHGLTSIILQCAAAERLVERDPEAARAPIEAVEGAGAEVELELAELLGVLQGAGGEAAQLTRLPQLVGRAEETGMKIELEVDGDVARVPAGPAAAAYRIVQEGLTNARKHGAGDRARVRVAVEDECLRVAVENPVGDDGRADAAEGHGLIGISERVRIYAGRLRAGATERGTWSLEAELPLLAPTLTMPLS